MSDPKPSISYQDIIREEYKKCYASPVYFMNHYVKIQHPIRGTIVFDLFPFQEKTLQDLHDYNFNIILKSRQMGISTLVAAYSLWLMIFHKDKNILIISLKQDVAKEIITKVRFANDNLPTWLKIKCEEDNRLSLKFENGSQIRATSTTKKSGVSLALSLLIIDEAGLIDEAEDLWTSAQPTLSTGGRAIILSTPRGIGNWFHKMWIGSEENNDGKTGKNGFHPIKLPWDLHPERDSEWRRIEGEKQGNPKKAAQEFDCDFIATGDNVVDLSIVEWYRKTKKKDPSDVRGIDRGLWVWQFPDYSHSYIVCLPTGEKVLTDKGIKSIEDVTYNDELIDKDGRYTTIEDIKVRSYNGKVYEITPSNTFRTTKFTDEHPIFVSQTSKLLRMYKKNDATYSFNQRYWEHNFQFVDAQSVKKNDWICVPNIYKVNNISPDLDVLWNEFNNIGRVDFQLKNNPLLKGEFWWFVGIWLAEGWCYTDKHENVTVYTSHNSEEIDIINKLKYVVEQIIGRTLIITKKEDNATVCQFNSKQIGMFLETHFGKYAGGKFISETIKYTSPEVKRNLIQGYVAGDGCILTNSRDAKSIKITSISLRLLEDVQDMLFSAGCVSAINLLRKKKQTRIRGKIINQQQAYSLIVSDYGCKYFLGNHIPKSKSQRTADCYLSPDEKYIYFRVKKIVEKDYNGMVHNFTTTSGTFLCKNITTHNCADVARGDGSDFSAAHVIDISTITPTQVAEYKGNLGTNDFGNFLVGLSTEYNNSLLIVERENVGWATLQAIINRQYGNLFYSSADLKYVDVQRQLSNKYYGEEKKLVPGFSTNIKTRPLVIAHLEQFFRDKSIDIFSARTISELETFIWKNGKAQAMEGYNDDLIMSLGIGLWVRDTALRLRQEGIELTRVAVDQMNRNKIDQVPVYKSNQVQNASKTWEMQTGRHGPGQHGTEDIRWLIS
jgi:intein/homing endonuclease